VRWSNRSRFLDKCGVGELISTSLKGALSLPPSSLPVQADTFNNRVRLVVISRMATTIAGSSSGHENGVGKCMDESSV